jgi:hypothetical protein
VSPLFYGALIGAGGLAVGLPLVWLNSRNGQFWLWWHFNIMPLDALPEGYWWWRP